MQDCLIPTCLVNRLWIPWVTFFGTKPNKRYVLVLIPKLWKWSLSQTFIHFQPTQVTSFDDRRKKNAKGITVREYYQLRCYQDKYSGYETCRISFVFSILVMRKLTFRWIQLFVKNNISNEFLTKIVQTKMWSCLCALLAMLLGFIMIHFNLYPFAPEKIYDLGICCRVNCQCNKKCLRSKR